MSALSASRDVLKTATNLHIDDGGGGHGDQFTIRGSVTNDILILVNGRRIAGENIYPNGSSNTRILDRLNLSNVERIEIVRGPGGALYGSDAQGGVINIITKKSEKTRIYHRYDIRQQGNEQLLSLGYRTRQQIQRRT